MYSQIEHDNNDKTMYSQIEHGNNDKPCIVR